MAAAFSMLFAKIAAVLTWIGALWAAVFVAIWLVCKDAFSWLFEQVLKVAVSAISALDVSGLQSYASSAGTLPAEILNVLSLLGVGTAISIITAAIAIRLVLQLIPFTRLGS
ncbi:DUF2523 family protein [Variovorax sp. GB1P17]|uniref:DUF2523 family protein n=1 Tax=Variovorax sp. GB1P17 TaxID=3443740 RepID=UPI003F48BFAE